MRDRITNIVILSRSYSITLHRPKFVSLTCTVSKGHCVLCFSFFFWLHVLDIAEYSVFESTLNSSIVSYRILVLEAQVLVLVLVLGHLVLVLVPVLESQVLDYNTHCMWHFKLYNLAIFRLFLNFFSSSTYWSLILCNTTEFCPWSLIKVNPKQLYCMNIKHSCAMLCEIIIDFNFRSKNLTDA